MIGVRALSAHRRKASPALVILTALALAALSAPVLFPARSAVNRRAGR